MDNPHQLGHNDNMNEEGCERILGDTIEYFIRVIFNGQSIEILDEDLMNNHEFDHEEKTFKSHWIPMNIFLNKMLFFNQEQNNNEEFNKESQSKGQPKCDNSQFQATIGI